ncbi:MAG: hypothetical protein ACRCYY_09275 [Trueperaceae bacterium]
MSKALRLPIILVALMLMFGIISWLRPRATVEPPVRSSTVEVESFEPEKANDLVRINGLSETGYAAQVQEQSKTTPLALQKPDVWTPAYIRSIESQGNKTIIVFVDDSTREVTPTLYQQLPSALKDRMDYERGR